MNRMKMRLLLMFEPWFLPMQIMSIAYAAFYYGPDTFAKVMVFFWFFMLPLLAGTQPVKYVALNQPRHVWRRDFMIATSIFFVIMGAIALWRNYDSVGLHLATFCLGWIFSYFLHARSYGKVRTLVVGGADNRRPVTPAWCHTVFIPMLTPWLIGSALILMVSCFLAHRNLPLDKVAPFLGGCSGLWFFALLCTQSSFRGWSALGRPRSQWIKLSWLADALAVALAGIVGALVAAIFAADQSCVKAACIAMLVGLFMVAIGNTATFLPRIGLIATVIGVISGGGILVGALLGLFWDNRMLMSLIAAIVLLLSMVCEFLARPRLVRSFNIRESPFNSAK